MKNLYIIHRNARGSLYGIGTYLDMLLVCAKSLDVLVTVVIVNDESVVETTVEFRNQVRYIHIPNPISFQYDSGDYQTSVAWVLKEFVNDSDQNVFHLNRMDLGQLAKGLKAHFRGRLVLTVHYTHWSQVLLGNKKQLLRILAKSKDELLPMEIHIQQHFIHESELMNCYCDHVITISQHSCQNIISLHKVDVNKITLIPNALKDIYRPMSADRKLTLKRKLFIDANEKVILFCGRVDQVKGIDFLIEAFKMVLERHQAVRLVIVGSGDMFPVFRTSRHLSSKITFTGFISKKEVNRWYSIADIGVVPSLHEEFGYTAIEMMMYKIPIIVNNTTGLAEIIEEEIDGLYVNLNSGKRASRQSVDELAEKIIFLLENEDAGRKMSALARRKFLKRYNMNLFQRKIKDLYDKVFDSFEGGTTP